MKREGYLDLCSDEAKNGIKGMKNSHQNVSGWPSGICKSFYIFFATHAEEISSFEPQWCLWNDQTEWWFF